MKLIKRYKEFTLRLIKPHVYIITGKNRFDIAIHFLRSQEWYECSNSKFRGKSFDLLDYIDWYSKERGNGAFTYPTDFIGFNLTDDIFDKVYKPDFYFNKYDKRMMEIYRDVREHNGEGRFTIMGVLEGDKETIDHELAHAYWYLYPSYRREMRKLIKELPEDIKLNVETALAKSMYSANVFPDETQAYISTGLGDDMEVPDKIIEQFKEVFNKYNNI